jgi:phosphoenolpyruvate---glycerone phosphotransferase subunit DhaK
MAGSDLAFLRGTNAKMKKILNQATAYVEEMLEGLCLAHPDYYVQTGTENRVIVRTSRKPKGRVAIVTGGGSGHLPVFTGYVGKGLADGCAIGEVFSSPSVDQIVDAIRAVNSGSGVLLLQGNYSGDNMNFEMASEIVQLDGIETRIVRVADDVASASLEERSKRRGVAGLLYAYKITGAKAETAASLEEVSSIATKAAIATRSIGVALTSCTVPAVGRPTFTLGDDEMEIGMGIHGERGVRRGKLLTADAIAEEMLSLLLADMPLQPGDRVSVLVNSLGATPFEELFIVYRYVAHRLAAMRVEIVAPLVGRYATSMEMAGMSLTFCRLDDELEALVKAPCDSPFLKV